MKNYSSKKSSLNLKSKIVFKKDERKYACAHCATNEEQSERRRTGTLRFHGVTRPWAWLYLRTVHRSCVCVCIRCVQWGFDMAWQASTFIWSLSSDDEPSTLLKSIRLANCLQAPSPLFWVHSQWCHKPMSALAVGAAQATVSENKKGVVQGHSATQYGEYCDRDMFGLRQQQSASDINIWV